MYQVIIENYKDGNRECDSLFVKTYQRRKYAERKAEELTQDYNDTFYTKAYVRKKLSVVPKNVAKAAFCSCRAVYVEAKYGLEKLRPSYEYGSHAPAIEKFGRSLTAIVGWEQPYEGNFFIETDEIKSVEQRIKDGYGYC